MTYWEHNIRWIPIERTIYSRRARAHRLDVEAIHDLYIGVVHQEPCPNCKELCSSQRDFVDVNGGIPWVYCSACDPGLVEREAEYRPAGWTDADEIEQFGSVRPPN